VSLPLFGKRGVFREGQKDLRLSNPSSTSFRTSTSSSTETFQRLAKLTKKYHAGKVPQVDWLDRLTFAEIERINQKEKLSSNQLFLMIEFPQVLCQPLTFHN
jgi:phosphatidylinositol 3-kinase